MNTFLKPWLWLFLVLIFRAGKAKDRFAPFMLSIYARHYNEPQFHLRGFSLRVLRLRLTPSFQLFFVRLFTKSKAEMGPLVLTSAFDDNMSQRRTQSHSSAAAYVRICITYVIFYCLFSTYICPTFRLRF